MVQDVLRPLCSCWVKLYCYMVQMASIIYCVTVIMWCIAVLDHRGLGVWLMLIPLRHLVFAVQLVAPLGWRCDGFSCICYL